MEVKELFVEVKYSTKRKKNLFGKNKGEYLLNVDSLIVRDEEKALAYYERFEDEQRYLFKRLLVELSKDYRIKIISTNIKVVDLISSTYTDFPFYLKEDPFETYHREIEGLGWRRLQKMSPILSKSKKKFSIFEKYSIVRQTNEHPSNTLSRLEGGEIGVKSRVLELKEFHNYIKENLQRK